MITTKDFEIDKFYRDLLEGLFGDEDLQREALIKLYKKVKFEGLQLNDLKHARAYLIKILNGLRKNTYKNAWKTRVNHIGEDNTFLYDLKPEDPTIALQYDRDHLYFYMQKLGEQCYFILIHYYVYGYKIQEIAKMIELTPNHVSSRKKDCLADFRGYATKL
jgi:RNA polymerase sigma factor (sigma-70 family)